MDSSKILHLPYSTTAAVLRKLDDVTVSRDDVDVPIADDIAREAAREWKVSEVRGLANTRVEHLNSGRVPVVSLSTSKAEDLLANN